MTKKQPDKLAQDAAKALAAGMSYGKWKAMQKPAEPTEPKVHRKPFVCEYCGKTFYTTTNHKRKYCSDYCSQEWRKERERKQLLESRGENE